MKIANRLSGMAGILLLVSVFTAAKASAAVGEQHVQLTNATVQDRIAAIQGKLESTQEDMQAQLDAASDEAKADLVSQWFDWGDWGDWGDWVDWGDWADWSDWGDLSWSWGDGYWQGLGL